MEPRRSIFVSLFAVHRSYAKKFKEFERKRNFILSTTPFIICQYGFKIPFNFIHLDDALN